MYDGTYGMHVCVFCLMNVSKPRYIRYISVLEAMKILKICKWWNMYWW